MPLTPRRAAGWRPRGTPAPPGWQRQGLRAERGGGRRRARLRLRRGAPCAPGSARLGPLPAPARARRVLSGHAGHPAAGPQALRRWGARLGSCSGPGQPGGCGRERGGCMRLARARAKGEGAARPRRPGRPRAPRPERAPDAFALRSPGAGAARADGACRKFAEKPPRRLPARRRCGAASPGRVALLLWVCPPRRGHAGTLAHTGWHRHNPPAGVTGALLPAAKTCPRYGACAKAFPSPGGVSRGGVRGSAGLGGGSWGWESPQPRARRYLGERQRRSKERGPEERAPPARIRDL